jgi:hypothetical protein
MAKKEIFLSYAWGGESEKIIDELDNAFKNTGIALIRDKRDLGFTGMITEFMQRIGAGQAVVTVISDDYLRSPYCMFELLEIYRNLNFQKRIFPIVLKDADIFNSIPRLQYLKYWQDKKKELDHAITQFGVDAITVIGEDYKIYKKIFDNYGEVVNILKDINSLTPDMHRSGNFKALITEVTKLIDGDKTTNGDGVEPINWNFIVNTLRNEKCILFLGPELYQKDDNGKSKQQLFFENLAVENRARILSYNRDGFFLFPSTEDKTIVYRKFIDFFETQSDEEIIQKIAEIPAHVVVSINPDNALKNYFGKHNHPCSFEFFDKNQKKDIAVAPTKERPLLYNLFGSINNLETLILTHDDLFEYFKAAMGNNVLPLELRTALESASNYIFLGFQFDKWYVQLILCLLNLHDKNYHFIRYALENMMSSDTKSLCKDHFKIQFIGADTNAFINALHEKCKHAAILRDFNAVPTEDSADGRVNDLKQKIDREYSLLKDIEQKKQSEKSPLTIYMYDEEIEVINKKIAQYEKDLVSYHQMQL